MSSYAWVVSIPYTGSIDCFTRTTYSSIVSCSSIDSSSCSATRTCTNGNSPCALVVGRRSRHTKYIDTRRIVLQTVGTCQTNSLTENISSAWCYGIDRETTTCYTTCRCKCGTTATRSINTAIKNGSCTSTTRHQFKLSACSKRHLGYSSSNSIIGTESHISRSVLFYRNNRTKQRTVCTCCNSTIFRYSSRFSRKKGIVTSRSCTGTRRSRCCYTCTTQYSRITCIGTKGEGIAITRIVVYHQIVYLSCCNSQSRRETRSAGRFACISSSGA